MTQNRPEPPDRMGPLDKWRHCPHCEQYKVFTHQGIAPVIRENYWKCPQCGYIPNARL